MLILLARSFALSKNAHLPGITVNEATSMAYADVKHSENPPCCLRLTYRGDQQLFVL